jgi:hypothetical protein
MEEAYIELDNMFSAEQKEQLRTGEQQIGDLVLGFGLQLKEYWGLWQDSKIAKYLRRRDIEHPDQMVTYIFANYVDYLKKKEPQKAP